MIIGKLVEELIQIRNEYNLPLEQEEAICEACNILDKLPRLVDSWDVKEMLANKKTS